MRSLAAALVLIATPAAAEPTGEALWDAGRPAAAAAAFQTQWERDPRDAKAGLNAVIAYRVAGRYARARALLVRVRADAPLDGELAERAAELEARLTELTTELVILGEVGADAVYKVDGNPVEEIDQKLIVDPGPREISIEQPGCERWVIDRDAYPSTELELTVSLRCDHTGRVHLVFLGERDASLRIDGEPRAAGAGELDLPLDPGTHRVEVHSPIGVLFDEEIAVTTGAVANRRVVVPLRASGGTWLLATSGSMHVGAPGESGFIGAGIGRASHRGRWYVDLGMGRQPDGLVVGASGGLEVTRHVIRPLWRGRAAGAWWHAVVEPASVWLRIMSRIGSPVVAFDGSAGEAQDVLTAHAGSVGVTVDGASWHGEALVWPVGAMVRVTDRAQVGYGVAASMLLGFRF